MTHEELLAKWDNIPIDIGSATTVWKALRAVVELHYQDDYQNCKECKQGLDPCLTIQVIEKELM